VRDWEAVPAYKASLEQALGIDEAARLNEIVTPKLDAFGMAAHRIYNNFSAVLASHYASKVA